MEGEEQQKQGNDDTSSSGEPVAVPTRPANRWSTNDVQRWLKQIGLGEYAHLFVYDDGKALLRLTKQDLKEKLNIEAGKPSPVGRILSEIEELEVDETFVRHPLQVGRQQGYRLAPLTPTRHDHQELEQGWSPARPVTTHDLKITEERLRKEIKNMGNQKQSVTAMFTTYRDLYNGLKEKDKVVMREDDCPFAHSEEASHLASRIQKLFKKPPQYGARESTVVQPLWTKNLEQLARFKKKGKVDLVDRHDKSSFGNRKPDLAAYTEKQPQSVAHIAFLGELKGRRVEGKEDFDADEKGRLVDFLQVLLTDYQPYRTTVVGFLSDGAIIQFFILRRVREKDYDVDEWPPQMLDGDGGLWLARLLYDPTLGDTSSQLFENLTIKQKPIEVGEYLGSGSSAIVFEGRYKGERVVVKSFYDTVAAKASREREAKNLELLQRMQTGVPRLLGRTQKALIMRPVGGEFISSKFQRTGELVYLEHFVQLIDILQTVHETYNLVHRDISLSNFFSVIPGEPQHAAAAAATEQEMSTDDESETEEDVSASMPLADPFDLVFLNDWGSAVRQGQETYFQGALRHAPNHVLICWDNKETYIPQYADDLEMVVRAVFHRVDMAAYDQIAGVEDGRRLCAFWDHFLAPKVWHDMVVAAQCCRYKHLKKLLSQVLPRKFSPTQ